MKAFAQTIDLKDDPKAIEDYKRAHEKVWPEVIRAVSEVGVQKMKIFLVGTHLFMYYEARTFCNY
jgi:L-rhamnose mutarotase